MHLVGAESAAACSNREIGRFRHVGVFGFDGTCWCGGVRVMIGVDAGVAKELFERLLTPAEIQQSCC